jgi:predicted permease
MLRSFSKLQGVDAGFRTENILTLSLNLNFSRYSTADHQLDPVPISQYYDRLHETLRALPGVVHVAEAWTFPLNSGFRNDGTFDIEGQQKTGAGLPKATFIAVSPEYFESLGVPLMRGRAFDDHDQGTATQAVIVSQRLAVRHWGTEDPLGRRLSVDNGQTWRTIVGVVGDVRQVGLEREPEDAVYLPFAQFPGYAATLFVRSLSDPTALESQIRSEAHRLDADTAVSSVRTLGAIRSEALSQPRLTTTLLGLFAGVALMITATGLSGLIAYSVSQRTQEIGIRLALGAEPRGVLGMLMGQGLRSVGIGLGIGLLGALALSRLVSGLLFGVDPTDPLCFVGSTVVLVLVAMVACLLPARRALTIQPMVALRTD